MVASAPVIIADGHHRYETARTYQRERREATGGAPGPYDLVMALVVELSEDEVRVGAIHRTVSGPGNLDLVPAFGEWFDVIRAGAANERTVAALMEAGSMALVTPEDAYLLQPLAEAYDAADSDLDASLVQLVFDRLETGYETTHRHYVARGHPGRRRRFGERRRAPAAGHDRPDCRVGHGPAADAAQDDLLHTQAPDGHGLQASRALTHPSRAAARDAGPPALRSGQARARRSQHASVDHQRSVDHPAGARTQEGPEVASTTCILGPDDLRRHLLAVLGPFDCTEDPDGGRLVGAVGQTRQGERQPRIVS